MTTSLLAACHAPLSHGDIRLLACAEKLRNAVRTDALAEKLSAALAGRRMTTRGLVLVIIGELSWHNYRKVHKLYSKTLQVVTETHIDKWDVMKFGKSRLLFQYNYN